MVETRNGSGFATKQHVWGNYVDELLMFNDDAGDDSDYFLCHNQIFSPGATVDSTGAIVERYDYDAYGQPTIYTADGGDSDWWDGDETTATASAKGLVYLFTGREYEPLDGAGLPLQYSRARYHARWLQRDPAGHIDGMSLYEYVGSEPMGLVDWEGLKGIKCKKGEVCVWNGKPYTVNGCGSGSTTPLIPDRIGRVNFTWACNNHDACYGDCDREKKWCDKELESDMRVECGLVLGNLVGGRLDYAGWLKLKACYKIAKAYRIAVEKLGEKAHTEAQKEFCKCCPANSKYAKWAKKNKPHYKKIQNTKYDNEEKDYNKWKKMEEKRRKEAKNKKYGIKVKLGRPRLLQSIRRLLKYRRTWMDDIVM